jgi:enoyl-CoA hydratase/carnithine racemase
MNGHVQVEREGRMTIVTLTRHESLNAINAAAEVALAAAFDAFEADPDQWSPSSRAPVTAPSLRASI